MSKKIITLLLSFGWICAVTADELPSTEEIALQSNTEEVAQPPANNEETPAAVKSKKPRFYPNDGYYPGGRYYPRGGSSYWENFKRGPKNRDNIDER